MKLASGLRSFLLYALFVVLSIEENSARKINTGYDQDGHDLERNLRKHDHGHPLSHMGHMMDPALQVFFMPNELKAGKTMPIYFPKTNLSSSPKLLTKEESDSIPFSISQLPFLLDFFSFSENSPQAKAIEYTLKQCELKPIEGETRFCATTLESMLDFALYVFGSSTRFKVLTTTRLINSSTLLQNYTILENPKEIFATRMIGCHTMPYPYAVFYCHSQESENKVFEVSLVGENGERVDAAAVCHMDTSRWDRDHVSFRVLRVEPGTSPVCHFFPSDNLVWVPFSASV
ncbi:hypothetical protein UlMin_032384 [Ulmus minor]